ncbi:ATP-binding protein [Flavobacterium sp.]|uniref:ATP-binding protein n=1 Tax=Flavobacterium sp. TaxID=239 RepID=UPI00286E029E|nr:ATP-binding protein [Flavobacterium sp.]
MSFTTARKNLKVSTYSKVVFLLLVSAVSFFVLYFILFYYSIQQQKQVSQNTTELYEKEINALLELNSESYFALITEISYWDELVNFVENKDIKWFNSSISYLVDTNKVDYIDSYNIDSQFITKVSTLKITSENYIPKEVFPILYKRKILKFIMKIPEGYVEVYGATIHPSEDPFKNKTKPRGYFFMVKLIDSKYFNNLEKISGSRISFYNKNENIDSKDMFITYPLKDLNGKKIDALVFKRPINVNFSTTKTILGIIALASIIGFSIFFYYAKKWSKTPIKLITNVLKGDQSAIQSLKKIRGEFRYIGKLFEENNNQKIQLQKSKIKVEESDRLKSAFLMNLSHEIRTPMNAIIGFSDLMANPNITEKEKNEYITIIKNSGKNLIGIIDDLVEMSKIETNLVLPNYSAVNLDTIVKSNFDAISITNTKENLDFKIIKNKASSKKNIITDSVKLSQILINLLNNALKFTDEGSVVLDYDIDSLNHKIVFEIKDSGIGIPENFKDNIFKRFNKLNVHSISANEGLGLGLAISKAYVEMLGGEISVQSQVGIGSTFKFWIPLKYEENFVETELKISDSEELLFEDTIKILVAEDDNVNYLLIQKILKSNKIQVIRAVDGLEAVRIFKGTILFNLVFMDIRMPNMDGYQAFKEIRLLDSKIPIIAQTSYSFPEEIAKIVETGFTDYISKPLDKTVVLDLVKKHIIK